MGKLFIDESGDTGLTLRSDGSGSSAWLVLAAVYFHSRRAYRRWREAHRAWDAAQSRRGTEFKFSSARHRSREAFLDVALLVPNWTWVASTVCKSRLRASHMTGDMYCTALRTALDATEAGSTVQTEVYLDARTVSEAQRRAVAAEVQAPTQITFGGNGQKSVFMPPRYLDSRESSGIQLADLVAGAVAESLRAARPRSQLVERLRCRGRDVDATRQLE